MCQAVRIGRCAARASHKIKIKKNSEKKDIMDPTDETIFHLKNASG